MKVTDEVRAVKGLDQFEGTHTFSIDSEDMGWITAILSDKLYGNKPLAVCREYMTNAVDAHVDAGKKMTPIRVTLPTQEAPELKIRDFGKGLSHDQVTNIYIKYGKSSKRESDNQIGAFGIGAKSAFAYSDAFTIVSVHGGKKNIYSVQLDSRKRGILIPLSSDNSTEPSGVEITVAIAPRDITLFRNTAIGVARFFDVTPEFVNLQGAELKAITKQIEFPRWYMMTETETSGYYYIRSNEPARAIMGGIGYPVSLSAMGEVDEDVRQVLNTQRLCMEFPIGALAVSANREGLDYSSKTKLAILDMVETVKKNVLDKVANGLDSFPDILAAINFVQDTRKTFSFAAVLLKDLAYKGVPLYLELSDLKVVTGKRPDGTNTYDVLEVETYYERRDRIYKGGEASLLSKQTAVVILDCPRNGINQRLKTLENQGFNYFQLLDKASPHFGDYWKKYGMDLFPDGKIFHASKVARTGMAGRATGLSRKAIKVFKLTDSENVHRSRACWHDADATILDQSAVKFFLPIHNFAIDKDTLPLSTREDCSLYRGRRAGRGFEFSQFVRHLNYKRRQAGVKDEIVYGIREKDVPALTQGKWQNCFLHWKDVMNKWLASLLAIERDDLVHNMGAENELGTLAEKILPLLNKGEVRDLCVKVQFHNNNLKKNWVKFNAFRDLLAYVGQDSGIVHPKGTPLDKEASEILKKFPILNIAKKNTSHLDSADWKTLADYVNEKV